jgi:surface protein
MSASATITITTSGWRKGRNAKGQDMWRHNDGRKTYKDPAEHTEAVVGNPITAPHAVHVSLPSERKTGPKLVRTDADFEDDVKKWCNPFTRDVTLARCGHISDWDTSKVTNCENVFKDQKDFNDDISRWDVSKVTTMESMFYSARAFNQAISAWDVSNVRQMRRMFFGAVAFNQPLCRWDVSNVTSMVCMFDHATSFNQTISDWDVSNVTSMQRMFSWAAAFNRPLAGWNVSKVTNMGCMFYEACAFNQALCGWDVSKVEDIESIYKGSNISLENQPPLPFTAGCCILA